MNQKIHDEIENAIHKASAAKRLLKNEDFKEIILEDFISVGSKDICLSEDVNNKNVRQELKARKILQDYIYDIIGNEKKLQGLNNE